MLVAFATLLLGSQMMWPGPASATTAVASDPTGDNGPGRDPRGDLTVVGADYTTSLVVLSATVASPEDPSSPNWASFTTGIQWSVEVNGDDTPDFSVFYTSAGSTVRDAVTFAGVCTPTRGFNAVVGQPNYTVAFPPSCIGSPASFRLRTFMTYNTGNSDSNDFAPDSGFCCSVTPTASASSTSVTSTAVTGPTVPTSGVVLAALPVEIQQQQQQQAEGVQQQQQALAGIFDLGDRQQQQQQQDGQQQQQQDGQQQQQQQQADAGAQPAGGQQQQQQPGQQQQQQQQSVPAVRPVAAPTAPVPIPTLARTGAAAGTQVPVAVALLLLGGCLIGAARLPGRSSSTSPRPRRL